VVVAFLSLSPAVASQTTAAPTVVGLTVAQAEAKLQAAGFKFAMFGYSGKRRRYTVRPFVPNEPPRSWSVCWQEGAADPLFIYAAPACVFTMPSLRGRTWRAAQRVLDRLGVSDSSFSVDPEYRLSGDPEYDWVVCSQRPRASVRVSVREIRSLARLGLAERVNKCP
jgi:beta-lactam-binding protein with PASTA domain